MEREGEKVGTFKNMSTRTIFDESLDWGQFHQRSDLLKRELSATCHSREIPDKSSYPADHDIKKISQI